ncbi:regulator of ime2 [Ophidiomyces ophidiicola]|nr:regulator of ime2 [Ophidiomyces ophidiicola]KAI1977146.1 regulator of ime2 [Ophidiomyces ophidiicola]KAI1986732.1 regulator of ime2 [Ophidiomyces ophidiicola]
MLLKPATPLTLLLLAAFVLLLLSVLSAPVIKSIPLATYQNLSFGVFGFCQGNDCRNIRVGYPREGIFNDSSRDGDFNLPASIRLSLTALLIVHPIAAFFAFICFSLAAAAHLHSPSHSPRYLMGLLILLLPTLLLSLLAFLVDILLFVPYLKWGGWIVLGATILLTSSGVVTCAMRRTLVSRKARKRRIAENAEMSGENYYNRQIVVKLDVPPVGSASDQKAPLPTELPRTGDTLESANNDAYRGNQSSNGFAPTEVLGYTRTPPTPPTNLYNNPPQSDPYRPSYPVRSDPNLRNQYSNASIRSNRSDGPYPPRGRGGYPSRGRGPPYGGPRGFAGGNRNGPRPGPPRRGRGGPPPGYPPQNRIYRPNEYPGYEAEPRYGGYGRPYQNGPRHPHQIQNTMTMGRDIELQPPSEPAYPAPIDTRNASGPKYGAGQSENPKSPTSVYSADAPYIPPRSNWNPQEYPIREAARNQQSPESPLGPTTQPRDMTRSPPTATTHPPSSYYGDTEPRFALPMTGVEPADVPSALVPGSSGEIPLRTAYDDFPPGARSPAASETSHFTSISQRGINPKWQPPQFESVRPNFPQGQDVLLSNNPDFALPTGRARANTGLGGRMPPPMPTIPGTPTGHRNVPKNIF